MSFYSKFKRHNNLQQSLPLVAGTAKTLRLFGRPCAGRYMPESTKSSAAIISERYDEKSYA